MHKKALETAAAVAVVWSALAAIANAQAGVPHYAVVDRISAPGTNWDYLSVDTQARRLYIAHDGVGALDLVNGHFTARLVHGGFTHAVVPLGQGLVATDDSAEGTVTLFEGMSGKVEAVVKIPRSSTKKGFHDPDALVVEPKTGLLVVVNGDSSELVFVDIKKALVVGTIAIGGDLEYPVADGTGTLFVNIASENKIAVIDIPNRKLVKKFDLEHCRGPTGIAFDAADNLLVSVCHDGVVKFVDAKSGVTVRTLRVGSRPDAVLFDSVRRLVLVPSGGTGTLSIIALRNRVDIALVQTLRTQVGSRTAALDPQTGRVYLPAARLNPPTATFPFHSAKEGTFAIIVVSPQ